MKILIVNCVFDPEPVVSAQIGKSLVEKLVELKHTVTVISPYPSRPSGFQFEKKIKYLNKITEVVNIPHLKELKLPSFVYPKSNPIGRLFEGISFGWHSYKYIVNNARHLDVVYMNTWPLFGQLGVALACKRSHIKYIVHVQDIYPESLVNKLPMLLAGIVLKLSMPIEKYVIRNSFKIVVISRYMKSKIFSRGKIDNEKISIVNNYLKENQQYDFVDCYWSLEENFKRFYAGYEIGRFGTEEAPHLFMNPDGIQGKNDLEIIEDTLYHYTKSL
jgi:hypothetical protein